ncbi:MAG: hypothetical protein R3A48_11405 [Polyangiales bacterium]
MAVGPDGAPLPVLDGSTSVEGNVVARTVLMPRGDTYGVRVDGAGSLRYFGCAAQLSARGAGRRAGCASRWSPGRGTWRST